MLDVFDRRVTVDAPDLQGRVAILKVHSRNKKLDSDVRLEDIAKSRRDLLEPIWQTY